MFATPVDLTSATGTMTILDSPVTGNVLRTLTVGNGITLDNNNKTITIKFATAGLTWNLGYFNLEMTDGTGLVTQIAVGTITIE